MLIGLVVNPIAGMGGRVGLKGTDGEPILSESVKRGAEPIAGTRTLEALRAAGPLDHHDFLTAAGDMGGQLLREVGARYEVVYFPSSPTSSKDTVEACRRIADRGVRIMVFAGGDGTARNVMDAIDLRIPVMAIPSGVKMHSGVFSVTPEASGRLLRGFVSDAFPLRKAEVMDVDEIAFRKGRLSASLHGHMMIPYEPSLVQPAKSEAGGGSTEDEKDEIGQYFAELVERDVIYILGPGTTVDAVARHIGVEKTLLGVDVVMNGRLIVRDASEKDLVTTLESRLEARIVVTPIGAQGFIFGRGNQQISPAVIRKVGLDNIVVVASPSKLRETKRLRLDTGDAELDATLKGHRKVITGYARRSVVKVE